MCSSDLQKGCVVGASSVETTAGATPSSGLLRKAGRRSQPSVHWARYGLAPHTLWNLLSRQSRYESLPRPERFRLALEEAGGLFETFGRFLAGRADLLPSAYLTQLLNLRSSRKPLSDPAALPGIDGRVQEIGRAHV